METRKDIYDAEQLALEVQDVYVPGPVALTEEEWTDLLVIALS